MPDQAATMEDTPEEAPTQPDIVAGISPFDPDWLLMLAVAALADIITAVIALLGILDMWTITTVIAIAVDGFFFAVIGGWSYWRTNQMMQSKRERQEATVKRMEQQIEKLQKIGKGEQAQAAEKGFKVAQKALASLTRKAFVKALARFGAVLLGKIIPLVGLFPLWTISVFTMLWEKGE